MVEAGAILQDWWALEIIREFANIALKWSG